jgi:hypothetical protein
MERKAAEGLVWGKNFAERMEAMLPKMKKSYHSIRVPDAEAATTLHILLLFASISISINCFNYFLLQETILQRVMIKSASILYF